MPKTPRLTSKQVIKLLEENGFVLDHVSGSHYVFYHPVSKRRAVVPYHAKNLPLGTLKSILRSVDIE
jgi:predicted RNA binding protein YcfA (HicA-like mRNA interferase family)